MFAQTHRLDTPTGAHLAYHHEAARGAATGIIVICHGLAEHSRRYAGFAAAMASAGFHVYAHDHRGHGETVVDGTSIGRFAWENGGKAVIRDVKAIRDVATANHPGLPVLLFGHSMGGLIALNAVQDFPASFDALAIWNSNFNPGLAGRAAQVLLKTERALKGSDVPSTMLPKLTFAAWNKSIGEGRTDFDWLSRDHASVDAYVADPLCGFDASVSLWLDILELTFRGARRERLAKLPKALPIHLVGGGCDPATDRGRAIDWLAARMQAEDLANVTCTIHPDMRHETLNEIGATDAIADFAAWATRALPRSSTRPGPDWE